MNIKILQARYGMKLSQREMALLLGVSVRCYISIEQGIVNPRADVLYRLSRLCNVNIAYFYRKKNKNVDDILDVLKKNKFKKQVYILFEMMLITDIEMINEK